MNEEDSSRTPTGDNLPVDSALLRLNHRTRDHESQSSQNAGPVVPNTNQQNTVLSGPSISPTPRSPQTGRQAWFGRGAAAPDSPRIPRRPMSPRSPTLNTEANLVTNTGRDRPPDVLFTFRQASTQNGRPLVPVQTNPPPATIPRCIFLT